MRRITLVSVLLVVLLVVFGCKAKSDKDKMPDENIQKQITTFAPLPSFKEVFRTIDVFDVKDIDAATKDPVYKAKQDVPRNCFALGVHTADAIIASRSRNKKRLMELSTEMMKLTAMIGLESEFNRLGDDLKTMIEKEKWEDLENALDTLKREVEDKLWDSGEFDNYTLMLLGGWTQALNRMAFIADRNYKAENSKVLNQKGTWNSLLGNLEAIDKDYLINEEYFVQSKVLAKAVKAVLEADQNTTFTQDQLKELVNLSSKIKAEFQK